ncbi:unnamed protein product [Amoebophrya sp. A25]|nr:unnamed protein product [Amoebophrya sp. A25]|eukprot:GSA25T00027853001.1
MTKHTAPISPKNCHPLQLFKPDPKKDHTGPQTSESTLVSVQLRQASTSDLPHEKESTGDPLDEKESTPTSDITVQLLRTDRTTSHTRGNVD